MDPSSEFEKDFDAWATLADTDPQAFEDLRQALIEAFIEQAPPRCRPRLRCLQWRIEQERARSKTPLAACIRLTRMMWDKFYLLRTLVGELKEGHELESSAFGARATVIEFRSGKPG